MRFKTALIGITAGAMIAVGTVANAAPFSPTNTRPAGGVAPGEISGVPGSPNDLQDFLDLIFGCAGCVDAVADQSSAGMWGLPGALFPSAVPAIQVQNGAFANDVAFGIWSGTDDTAITFVEIFNGATGPGTTATIKWNAAVDPNTVIIEGGAGVNAGSFAGINQHAFGFYITTPHVGDADGKHWSVDDLNDGNVAQMLAYLNPTNGRWALAFEDLNRVIGADDNFIDLIVAIESIVAVPEPGSMILLGTGLIGLAAAARRRQRTRKA